IEITLDNQNLKINLIENPIIENIIFTGVKNKGIIKRLEESTALKSRMSFNEAALNNDINLINNFLKVSGYYFAKIKPIVTENNALNSVSLEFNIDLGEKAKIKNIAFIGNKKIKDKKLLEIIATEEHKFWKFVSNKVYLNQSIIDLDKRLLENYYKNLGYYNVSINNTFAELDSEGFFKLTYNIDAGEKFFFNNFKLELPDDYNLNDFNELENIFSKLKNKVYSINDLNMILNEIEKITSLELYDFIDAEILEDVVENNRINFTFNIKSSEIFYVEKINIFGNFQTIEEVLRNKLLVDEGDPLNNLLFNKSIDNLKALRIFKNVNATIKDGSNPNLKIIDINVEEQPTGEISLAAGIGTSGGSIGGGIIEKNFLGKGINLNTNIELTEDSVKGRFIYSKPNFAYTDNTLFTSLEATTADFLTQYGYKASKNSISIGTEFEQYQNLFYAPSLELSFEDIETNSTASQQLNKQEGSYTDLNFNYSLNYDLRDSKYQPKSGNQTSFFQELPIFSDNNEISNTFIFTQYKTLSQSSEMIGRGSFYFKSVNSTDGSDVRISKRAFLPQNRLRGFERGKVGPIDNNDYIGGNYLTALNFSTNIPEIFPTIENLDFSYFVDIANVWGVDYSDNINDSNKIRSSTGIGLDLLTPVGPLSFSLATPITKKSTDKTETFRFNLGTTF
ncbi:outer membrane protein assembly factor BamA, partial [Candidatus Pelagibacter sp.]|nr:outer membrane protein assembly factor BamA [Candidatus Pelagibacter sp.]